MTDFEIVSKEDVPARGPSTGRRPLPESIAMVEGHTLFIPGETESTIRRFRDRRSYVRVQGFRLRSRKAERNGVAGMYVWAEKQP